MSMARHGKRMSEFRLTPEQEFVGTIREDAFHALRDLVPDKKRAVDKAWHDAHAFARELMDGETVPTVEQVRRALAVMASKGITNLGYARAILERLGEYKPRVRIKEHRRGVFELADPFAEPEKEKE